MKNLWTPYKRCKEYADPSPRYIYKDMAQKYYFSKFFTTFFGVENKIFQPPSNWPVLSYILCTFHFWGYGGRGHPFFDYRCDVIYVFFTNEKGALIFQLKRGSSVIHWMNILLHFERMKYIGQTFSVSTFIKVHKNTSTLTSKSKSNPSFSPENKQNRAYANKNTSTLTSSETHL